MTTTNKALTLRNWVSVLPDVYRPVRREIEEALAAAGFDLGTIVALPLTNRAFNEIQSIEEDIRDEERDAGL